ncbi:MAG: DUF370 domain-containing protein [Eubacterium sp.]|nr:DUF370 domain-containing protein [Eubacterium sp.]
MSFLMNIGFGNAVNTDKVFAVVSPVAAPVKRLVAHARENGMLIDASQGRKTKAVLVLEDGRILLSALQPETITRRFNQCYDSDSFSWQEESTDCGESADEIKEERTDDLP